MLYVLIFPLLILTLAPGRGRAYGTSSLSNAPVGSRRSLPSSSARGKRSAFAD